MARKRNSYTRGWFDEPHRLAYARTQNPWQTRKGRRNKEFGSFPNLLGLNTAFDPLHKREGESPYLRNVRYMGEKQTTQRAQATSRSGARLLNTIGDEKDYPARTAAQTTIELWEGKSIEFDITFDDLITGGMLYIKNTEQAKGILRIILKEDKDAEPISDAIINLEGLNRLKFSRKEFRFIQGLETKTATIRLEILDDVELENCKDPEPIEARKIEILATGASNHRAAESQLPNTDKCLREQEIVFEEAPAIPLFGKMTNCLKVLPRGIQICCDGCEWLVYPVCDKEGVSLYRERLPSAAGLKPCNQHEGKCKRKVCKSSKPVKIDAPVWKDACNVRFGIADGYLYYVDGNSPLQRIEICTWKHEIACPTDDEVDIGVDADGNPNVNEPSNPNYVDATTLKAKEGASLIKVLNNRVYLSGFADDPNFVAVSLIDGEGPKYDQFNDGFYSPNRSPKDSACGPITAFAQLENNLVIFRTDGNAVYQSNGGLTFGQPQLVDTFAWNIGVHSQEDVDEGNGNIYYYNRSEGFRRFAGTESSFQSISIDNELRKIDHDDRRFVLAHANKVRLWFDRNDIGYSDHCALYHTMLAGSSPWYMDNQTPVMWAVGDQTTDRIYAMHSQYPATYIVDHSEKNDDQLTDFDSTIPFEYSTNYKSPGSLSGYTILRRVILKVIASSTNSWFIGVDKNHEDNPAVWRKFVRGQVDGDNNEDAVFGNTAEAGSETISIGMRSKVRDVQVRVKVFCYRSHAELMYIEMQYGGKEAL